LDGCVSPQIIIRPAVEQDVPALVRLLRRSWLVAWAPELSFDAVQAFAAVDPARLHAEHEWRSFTIAVRGSELLGMFQIDHDRLQSLHVDPGHWNEGVGTKLLVSAKARIARAHQLARLEVRSFNTRAQVFYSRRGWTEVRRYPGTECGSPVENVEMQKQFF
jgi:ribosomal protein S18 acetylase RimI-like enzyme